VWTPGDTLAIDWGSQGGLHVFCAVLAWSRVRFVRFAANEKSETTLRMLAECFEVLGGVPKTVLADRMGCLKAGVVANVVVPTADYVRFATHYGFRPDFCQAAGPESKGIVENLAGFLAVETRAAHPMVPLGLFRSRNVSVPVGVGFAFVVGFYGLPFVMSLYLQQVRHLSPFATGAVFLPMALFGGLLTPFSPRLAERFGPRRVIGGGLTAMAAGLALLALVSPAAPTWGLALLMVLVGLAGPTVMPPATAVLLNAVPGHQAGIASGVFNTGRQVGGALAVAVFGALLSRQQDLASGLRISLLAASAVALGAIPAIGLLAGPPRSAAPRRTAIEEVAEMTSPGSRP